MQTCAEIKLFIACGEAEFKKLVNEGTRLEITGRVAKDVLLTACMMEYSNNLNTGLLSGLKEPLTSFVPAQMTNPKQPRKITAMLKDYAPNSAA